MRERDYDNSKKRIALRFIGHILRLQDKDIGSELRGEFLMQFIPLSEYRKLSAIEDAKEERTLEVARSMISEGLPLETIKKCTGLDEDDILALG
jgi:predicted transposase/invertase (TIGR01784 family)